MDRQVGPRMTQESVFATVKRSFLTTVILSLTENPEKEVSG